MGRAVAGLFTSVAAFRRPTLFGAIIALLTMIGVQMLASEPSRAQTNDTTKRVTFTTVTLGGESIEVGIYRPRGCKGDRLLFVFHGYERDAGSYLRSARRIARELCMTVVAPRLNQERFPSWLYQRAGVGRGAAGIEQTHSLGPLIAELVDWARTNVTKPDADYVLFGHSAGAQMLSRVAAYHPLPGPLRIVIANPSSHVAPSLKERVPYGFRAAGAPPLESELLKRYLAQPITLYLGSDDVGEFRLLKNRAAQRQGANRLERGRAIYQQAVRISAQNGWTLNWRLVEAPGIGHSGRGMLRAPEAAAAISPGPAQP